ncbi:MAG: SIR2 family protein [Chlorobiales bacterium]|nr:SIR2 family protein [Chlorobiales bacterium]
MISNYISSEKSYTFLTGAGISYNSPSNLPLARDIVFKTINALSIDENIKDQIKDSFDSGTLRFEQFMELITDIFDSNLDILNQLSMCSSPNLIHHLLAEFIRGNHCVFTTNFDCLIEKACINMGISIQTVFSNEQHIDEETKSVWKLHGSLQDENGHDTKNSIVATMKRLGQSGEAFSNNPFLKDVFISSICKNDLIVIGYSGSDDYDIVPMISQANTPNRIYWVWHDQNMRQIQVFPYRKFKSRKAKEIFEKLFSFGNWKENQIFVIAGNTTEILTEIGRILSNNFVSNHHYGNEYIVPSYYYSKWSLKYALEDWRNIGFLGNYFLTIRNYGEAYRYFLLTLSITDDAKEIFPKLYVLSKLATICIRGHQPELALDYLEEIDKLLNEEKKSSYFQIEQRMLKHYGNFVTNYYQHRAICCTEMGDLEGALKMLQKANSQEGSIEYARGLYEKARIMKKKGDLPTALILIQEAISIHRKHGNLESLAICLTFLTGELVKLHEFDKAKKGLYEIVGICNITNNHALLATCQQRLENI